MEQHLVEALASKVRARSRLLNLIESRDREADDHPSQHDVLEPSDSYPIKNYMSTSAC